MDRRVLTQLKRSELQALAKRNNIKATQSSAALIDELSALPHPNIDGVPALKQKMSKDALMRQKIMQRNGYALKPKAEPARRGKVRQEQPANERASSKHKPAVSKRGAKAGTATDRAAKASSSKDSGGQLEDVDAVQSNTSGSAHEDNGIMEPTAQAEPALGHNVLGPALRRGNVVPEAGAQAKAGPKEDGVPDTMNTSQQLNSLAEDDEDSRDEEEVEAMTSLEDIVVDLSSPARPEGRKGKRKAECDFVESPRPAKRTRSLRVA
ncbi:hypothetical protein C8Q80DRAFT_1267524 [Daedaleopsis nitida]|nr:hypothetical protein C8Q80DRAFT_1267524 [Daedaleopsis nitida]